MSQIPYTLQSEMQPADKGLNDYRLEIDLELLMRRISHARHLFDLEESSTVSLSGNFLHHMVSVEFDAINNEFLQLEVDFKAVGGRHERTKSRWIQSQVKGEFAENRPLLQAIMLGVQKYIPKKGLPYTSRIYY